MSLMLVFHPLLGMHRVQAHEGETLIKSGLWFDTQAKANEMKRSFDHGERLHNEKRESSINRKQQTKNGARAKELNSSASKSSTAGASKVSG
jgi:hypothetical protein